MNTPTRSILRAGLLMSTPGEPLRRHCSVHLVDGRIEAVRDDPPGEPPAPAEVPVLDLSDYCVMPGLIDSHVHSLYEVGNRSIADFVTRSDADLALQGVHFTRKLLEAGFTTLRDLGNMQGSDAIYSLRDAIVNGLISGPRIVGVGAFISPTGGGGDIGGLRPDVCCVVKSSGICDGADACRRSVREQIKRGADVVKIILTGSVLSNSRSGLGVQFHEDELQAIVDTAHLMGRPVAVHAHGAEGVKAALRAGVDSVEHASSLDDEAIELFSRSNAFLVPTLLAVHTVSELAQREGYYPKAIREKARLLGRTSRENLSRARQAGIKIAFGTDSGVFPHGQGARELALMVDAGFTAAQAIESATVRAAQLLGLASEVGTLAPGKWADIIAVRGDPYEDVRVLENVRLVMARGKLAYDRRDEEQSPVK